MKFYLYVGLLLLLVIHWVSASDQTSIEAEKTLDRRIKLVRMLGTKLRTWWTKFLSENENQNTFTGRCIGVAKKIKQLLPFLVFKLGAIMTLLGFLTLFSLKSLGLLALLLLINTSAIVAKVTAAFAHKQQENKKQNIHLHIHSGKDGYHMDGASYGWEDKSSRSDYDESDSYNLYDKLIRNPYSRSYDNVNN